jgi:uncharacterized protein YijF (DUF1287 family)
MHIFLLSLLLLSCSDSLLADPAFGQRLADAAQQRTRAQVRYDPAYIRIPYPGGDVPADTGVCTDVVIRSYRSLGIDLQQSVHQDMRRHFSRYPQFWGLKQPDSNIDHRRVPNLRVFFTRQGQSLPVTEDPADYQPGDLVTWMLPGNLPHIGIVAAQRSTDGLRPLIIHNIGAGPQQEDRLFEFPINGHYRYQPNATARRQP